MGHLITETDVVRCNTQSQALISLDAEAREAGFKRSVTITAAAHSMAVAVATAGTGVWEERARRLALLMALRRAIANARPGQRLVAFRVPVQRDRPRPETVQLRTVCGLGAIIIRIPGER